MKVLVVGAGGREHAICQAFLRSEKISEILCIGQNAGIEKIAKMFDVGINNFYEIAKIAKENNVDFTFVGPEQPLAEGIVDYFEKEGLKIIGPKKSMALLEASKIYAKEFMQRIDVPTPTYNSFPDGDAAIEFLNSAKDAPIVVKVDGLAQGKGVYVCKTRFEAIEALKNLMKDEKLSAQKIILEEFIDGTEASYLVFTDGKSYKLMPPVQDYKRLLNNDQGPNTGGMGAYSHHPFASKPLNDLVEKNIIAKVVEVIKEEKLGYKGVLYFGITVKDDAPYVLEFNCRFGDPEAQVILPLLRTDFVDICLAILNEKLGDMHITWEKEFAVCVVLASKGYPKSWEIGFEISGLDKVKKDALVFHSATKDSNGKVVTNGGRVLCVVGIANSLEYARDNAYENVALIHFEGMQFRTDIAEV